MSYSVDFRKCVISYIESGGSQTSASKIFNLSLQTVKNWISLKRETGSLSPKSHGGGHPQRICPTKLEDYVNSNPEKTLQEIAKEFQVSHVSIWNILRKLNYVSKKRPYSIQKKMKKNEQSISRK